MERKLNDDLERRLRAARPWHARADEQALDTELLARVRQQPVARRTVPRTVGASVAVGVTVMGVAALTLVGAPGDVAGPSSASAITQTLRWLDPPRGTILHVRSVEVMGAHTTTRELWQSVDHPDSGRLRTAGADAYETAGGALYDPAANTIYEAAVSSPQGRVIPTERARQKASAVTPPVPGKLDAAAMPAGDPIVDKVRILLREGRMVVTGPEAHNGTEAWAISLKPDVGRPVWTLWVSAADGKPLELRDPGRNASEQPQDIRWTAYDVLPGSDANQLLTLTGAHPSAHVVRDPGQAAAAEARLWPHKP